MGGAAVSTCELFTCELSAPGLHKASVGSTGKDFACRRDSRISSVVARSTRKCSAAAYFLLGWIANAKAQQESGTSGPLFLPSLHDASLDEATMGVVIAASKD